MVSTEQKRYEQSEASKRVQHFAWVLDSSIPLPFGWRIGIEPFIGLVPGFGDTLGGILGTYIIAEATKAGLPISVILRMIWNVLWDMALGALPFVGDFLDFAVKANRKNAILFDSYISDPKLTRRRSRTVVAAIVFIFLLLVSAMAFAVFWILRFLWNLLETGMQGTTF